MPRPKEPVKYCRYCGRIIRLDAADCPFCERNVIKHAGMKECPFCGELVRDKAIKCKHCGEFLDRPRSEAGTESRRIVYIDKAVIAGSPEQMPELLAKQAGEEADAQEAVPPQRQLEAGGSHALARLQPAPVPARVEDAAPPAHEEPPQAQPEELPPTVQVKCPSCGRFVFEDDNFCENCGRDLSVPAGRSEFPAKPRNYEPSYYALMAGAAAPVGLVFGRPLSLVLPAAAGALAVWCVLRIGFSRDPLLGLGRAVGGLVSSAFWMLVAASIGA